MTSAEMQGNLWGAEADDWADLFEPFNQPLWVAMLASANVTSDTRFLDLGCGGGGASALAARQGARVAGLDAARALIEIARKRVPDGDFRVGDLEELPYQDDRFDVTFASLSLMFAADTTKAVSEMRRVTVPGGRVTIGIWGVPEASEYRFILQAVAGTLPSPPSGAGPFALSTPGVLEEMMAAAGLTVLDSGTVDVPFLFADSAMLWRMVRSAGPVQAALNQVDESVLKTAVVQAAEPFQGENGAILMNNQFRYVTARV